MKIIMFLLFTITILPQIKISELDTVTTTATTDRFLYTSGSSSYAISYYRLGLRLATFGAIGDSLANRVSTVSAQTVGGLKKSFKTRAHV